MTIDPQAGSSRGEAGSRERNAVDLGTTVATVAGKTERSAMLRMLAGADDGHCHGIAIGVLDGLFVNHDAHAPPTVANRRFPARVCGKWVPGWACETDPMDPLAFHREALAVAQGVVDGIDRSHFELPTPCDEWNVRQVLEHIIEGNRRIAGDPPAAGEDVIGDDLSAAYARSAAGSLAAFSADGAMDRLFMLSIGQVPGHFAVLARSTDQLAHAWDLARATGASTDLSPELYMSALDVLHERFATRGRNDKTYAEEKVPPHDATAADRFAAFAGRRA
jgi:uncharacterized protein (TIGR03086 family)